MQVQMEHKAEKKAVNFGAMATAICWPSVVMVVGGSLARPGLFEILLMWFYGKKNV